MGDRLRRARALTGMDQREFAERLGMSRTTVGRAETDTRDSQDHFQNLVKSDRCTGGMAADRRGRRGALADHGQN